MIRDSIIHIFATAMALASSGIVFGATETVAPHITTVQVGSAVQVGGTVQVGSLCGRSRSCAAILHTLDRKVMAVEANNALRPVERLMLVDGGIGIDLVRLAQVLPLDTKINVNGTYDRVEPAKVASKLPLSSVDALQVAQMKIDGVVIMQATPAEAKRIQNQATQRVLRYVHELHPFMADGPEPVVDSVEVITTDHAVVSVHFVSGWTHQPIPGSNAQALVVLSGDDEVHVIQGQLQ